MASFYAELEVAGHSYPVRLCEFSFTQATNERGQVAAKVRHGLLHLTLDVPDGEQLLAWGTALHQPLAGHVTFYETNRLTARETVGFAAGECVGYEETFVAGDNADGAYVCRLTVAAEKLQLTPGGPARAFVPAAAREYAAAASSAVPADWMAPDRWADKLRSQSGFLGSRKLSRKELAGWTNRLSNDYGVTLEILQKGSPILAYMDAHGKQGGFLASAKTIYLRPVPTYYEVAHEAKHAEQWHKLGSERYGEQSRFDKEAYVYEGLMKDQDKLTPQEIKHATDYINDIRKDNGLLPLKNL